MSRELEALIFPEKPSAKALVLRIKWKKFRVAQRQVGEREILEVGLARFGSKWGVDPVPSSWTESASLKKRFAFRRKGS